MTIISTQRVTGGMNPRIRFSFSDGTQLQSKADGNAVQYEPAEYTNLISNWFNS